MSGAARRIDHRFSTISEQKAVRSAIERICQHFADDCWLRDRDSGFPHELPAMLAADGWLGIAMPEAIGTEALASPRAAITMQAITASDAGMTGASAVHMNIFGLNPVVVFGTPEQKQRMPPKSS